MTDLPAALRALTDDELVEFVATVDIACDDAADHPGVVKVLDAVIAVVAAEQSRRLSTPKEGTP